MALHIEMDTKARFTLLGHGKPTCETLSHMACPIRCFPMRAILTDTTQVTLTLEKIPALLWFDLDAI